MELINIEDDIPQTREDIKAILLMQLQTMIEDSKEYHLPVKEKCMLVEQIVNLSQELRQYLG